MKQLLQKRAAGIFVIGAIFLQFPLLAEPAPALVEVDGSVKRSWIHEATERVLKYSNTEVSTKKSEISRAKVGSVYFMEPKLFSVGIEAFSKGDFSKAAQKFKSCQQAYEGTLVLLGNYSTLSAFYEIECARLAGDFEKLEVLAKSFSAEPLVRKSHRSQVELYPLYGLLQAGDYSKLEKLLTKWEEEKLIEGLQAQVFYFKGRVQEEKGESTAALNSYSQAFVLGGNSQIHLRSEAIKRSLGILKNDKSVQEAMKLFGTDKSLPEASIPMILLYSGAGLTKQWELINGSSKPLPKEFVDFKKYRKSAKKG